MESSNTQPVEPNEAPQGEEFRVAITYTVHIHREGVYPNAKAAYWNAGQDFMIDVPSGAVHVQGVVVMRRNPRMEGEWVHVHFCDNCSKEIVGRARIARFDGANDEVWCQDCWKRTYGEEVNNGSQNESSGSGQQLSFA